MAYTAYELTAGDGLKDLETLCGHLTFEGHFDGDSLPNITEIERWFNIARAKVAAILVSNGYSATQTDADVVAILQELNVYEVAVKCELSNPSAGQGENNRMEFFQSRIDALVAMIEDDTLEQLGGDRPNSATPFQVEITGTSDSEKRSVNSDTDLVKHRFQRDMLKNPLAGGPPTTSHVEVPDR